MSGTDQGHFNLPTDVAFGPDGTVYVSDGYGSARVVKFSSDGEFLLEWGKRGTAPGEFGLPHNLVVDETGRVYVTDRDSQRIQVFDSDGKFLDEWKGGGRIPTLFMAADQRIWAGGVLRNLDGTKAARLPGNVGGTARQSLRTEAYSSRNSAESCRDSFTRGGDTQDHPATEIRMPCHAAAFPALSDP